MGLVYQYINEKSDQAGVVEEIGEMLRYLTRGVHTICAQKESSSVLTKLYDGDSVLIGNDAVDCWHRQHPYKDFDGQVQSLTNVRHVPNLKKDLLS